MLDDPKVEVKDAALSANGKGVLIRTDKWAYMEYGNNGTGGSMLYDMVKDPKQYTNLAKNPEYAKQLKAMKDKLNAKLKEVKTNDL